MISIAQESLEGRLAARVVLVASDRADAPGLQAARRLGMETRALEPTSGSDRAAFETLLGAALFSCTPDLVVLAGFMRVLSGEFVARFAGRMLNIHPSLLPKYRGLHTHRRVLAAGDHEHGASVHYVTAELDGGPVVLQSRIAVKPDDTEASLAARVLRTEHVIYPRVIGWIAAGRLHWHEGQPVLDGQRLNQPVVEDMSAYVAP